jgi:hypothetical protein
MTYLAALAAAPALLVTAAHAGPCTADLNALQPQVDALVETTAGQGKFAVQSDAATQSRQPTPQSLANAEAKLGEGQKAQAAVDAMAEARKADASGDAAQCAAATSRVRSILKP